MNTRIQAPAAEKSGVECAVRHALGWLVLGNGIGLFLSLLLLRPEWEPARWTYGHWVPLHLNAQLYGWTALPLVGWLLRIYEVDSSRFRAWGPAAVWAWTAAVGAACFLWLGGETSGKIFLDWRNSSLWGFIAALAILWLVLLLSFRDRSAGWGPLRRRISLAGLVMLALVPLTMGIAASPETYPPVDRTTGGPTGSSLLGSSLFVIGLMLLLPRVSGGGGHGKAGLGTWLYFSFSWLAFGVTEAIGGGHFDIWQIASMVLLLPWVWLVPRDWSGFTWPAHSRAWRISLIFWWALLTISGVTMYSPGLLDHLKFTQGLVAHAHLAMAGFTTAFCALLITLLTGRRVGGPISVMLWNLAAFAMIVILAAMGWREGQSQEWMIIHAGWREAGFLARAACGLILLGAAMDWSFRIIRS